MPQTPITQNANPLPGVSRETISRLQEYVALLLKWNRTINLVGKTTEAEIWSRHIEDSLQLLPLIPKGISTMADLGSGAGLPGIVLAIARPDIGVTLVEQDQRKAAFLTEAKRVLGLENVTIEPKNIDLITRRFDLITARALASLTQLCGWAYPLLGTNAICLFPKGENFARELEEAGDKWGFQHRITPSKTHEKSCVISLSELSMKDGPSK
jgi:16S rRNA (guanine527-N7)-methyltransferase